MLISFFGDNQTITLGVCVYKRIDLIIFTRSFQDLCLALLGLSHCSEFENILYCSNKRQLGLGKTCPMMWVKFFFPNWLNRAKYYSSTKRISFLCCFGKCVEEKSRKQKFFPWEILSSFTHPKGDPKPNYWWLLAPSQLFFFILIKII